MGGKARLVCCGGGERREGLAGSCQTEPLSAGIAAMPQVGRGLPDRPDAVHVTHCAGIMTRYLDLASRPIPIADLLDGLPSCAASIIVGDGQMSPYSPTTPYRVWLGGVCSGSYQTASEAFNDLPRGGEQLNVTRGTDEACYEVWPNYGPITSSMRSQSA